MDKILILGSEGFTGRHFLNFLKKNKIKSENYLIDVVEKRLNESEKFYKVDLLKKEEIFEFLKKFKPDFIFNFIGLNFSNNLHELIKINIIAAENLLSSINEIKNYSPKILLIGSAAEYGIVDDSDLPVNETCKKRPINNYGLSKVFLDKLAEKYILNSKIRIYRAKPFNVIGPGQSENLVTGSISSQLKKIRNGLQPYELYVGNLEAERDFVDIRDVVAAYWKIMASNFSGEVFNIGSGKPIKIRNIVKNFIKFSGLDIRVLQKRKLVKKIDIPNIYADIKKIRKMLKWKPEIALKQSIKDTLN